MLVAINMLQVFSELDRGDINEVIMGKLVSMPSGTTTRQSLKYIV